MKRVTLCALCLLACSDSDDDPQATADTGVGDIGDAGSTADASTSGGSCPPGGEACQCREDGSCDGSLVCASNLCVDIDATGGAEEGDTEKPPLDTGDSGGEPGSCVGNCGDAVPHFGGICLCDPSCAVNDACCSDYAGACPGGCLYNDDCANDEVCNVEQECVPAWGRMYQVYVDVWRDHSTTCWDTLDCLADVYWFMYYGGELVYSSAQEDNVSEASWPDPGSVIIDTDNEVESNKVWSIVFYDADGASGDDAINLVCEPDAGDACSHIPLQYLKWGNVIWDQEPDWPYEVWVRFVPI